MLCVAFSTALAGGLHALAADLHELQTTLALFFGDVPFGADAARKLGDRFADLDGDPRRTVAVATEMTRQSHNSERAKQYDASGETRRATSRLLSKLSLGVEIVLRCSF